jgi:hypothetical protein
MAEYHNPIRIQSMRRKFPNSNFKDDNLPDHQAIFQPPISTIVGMEVISERRQILSAH